MTQRAAKCLEGPLCQTCSIIEEACVCVYRKSFIRSHFNKEGNSDVFQRSMNSSQCNYVEPLSFESYLICAFKPSTSAVETAISEAHVHAQAIQDNLLSPNVGNKLLICMKIMGKKCWNEHKSPFASKPLNTFHLFLFFFFFVPLLINDAVNWWVN